MLQRNDAAKRNLVHLRRLSRRDEKSKELRSVEVPVVPIHELPRRLTFSETQLTLRTKVGEQLPKPVGGQTHYHNYDEDARPYRDFRLSSIMLS